MLLGTIRALQFAAVVVREHGRFASVHVPVLVRDEPGSTAIEFHVAVGNDFWRKVGKGAEALMIVQGANAYVRPGWLETKKRTGKAVPTWNYVTVHAEGRVVPVRDRDWLLRHVRDLTAANEAGRDAPWTPEDAPADYIDKSLGAIVGLKLEVARLDGVWKMIQHHPRSNRVGVIEGLAQSQRAQDREVAEILRAQLLEDGD